jgi:hypothetical protein
MRLDVRLTLVDLQVRSGYDEDDTVLLGLPPVGFIAVHDGKRIAFGERELVRALTIVRVKSDRFDCKSR